LIYKPNPHRKVYEQRSKDILSGGTQ